jgi:hypothetical protein
MGSKEDREEPRRRKAQDTIAVRLHHHRQVLPVDQAHIVEVLAFVSVKGELGQGRQLRSFRVLQPCQLRGAAHARRGMR